MQLLAQGARFFELLGYGLFTSAFAILALGAVWSLTRSISDSYRFLLRLLFAFLIIKIAAATFFVIAFSTLPRVSSLGPPRPTLPINHHDQDSTNRETKEIEIQLLSDGRMVVQGEAHDSVASLELNAKHPSQVLVKIVPHSTTPVGRIQGITADLLERDLQNYTIQASNEVTDQKLERLAELP